MPLVAAKCTQCGGELKVDPSQEAAVCTFCKMPFVIEKAINNYNTINNIKADVVNVYGGKAADFVIRAGKLEKYNGAATEVVIPNTVNEIGGVKDGEDDFIGAFHDCGNLKSVTIPDSVTKIGKYAFRSCEALTAINIPNSVTHIGEGAFFGCENLTAVNIPNSVTYIGGGAFSYCHKITDVVFQGDVIIGKSDYSGVFSNVPRNVKIPYGTKLTFRGYNPDIADIVITESLENLTDEQLKILLGGLLSNSYKFAGIGFISEQTINNVDLKKLSEERMEQRFRNMSSEALPKATKKKTGCYIATAVYGSYDAPEVLILRSFRDNRLSKSLFGRAFIKIYYKVSPPIAVWMKDKTKINDTLKKILDFLINKLV